MTVRAQWCPRLSGLISRATSRRIIVGGCFLLHWVFLAVFAAVVNRKYYAWKPAQNHLSLRGAQKAVLLVAHLRNEAAATKRRTSSAQTTDQEVKERRSSFAQTTDSWFQAMGVLSATKPQRRRDTIKGDAAALFKPPTDATKDAPGGMEGFKDGAAALLHSASSQIQTPQIELAASDTRRVISTSLSRHDTRRISSTSLRSSGPLGSVTGCDCQ